VQIAHGMRRPGASRWPSSAQPGGLCSHQAIYYRLHRSRAICIIGATGKDEARRRVRISNGPHRACAGKRHSHDVVKWGLSGDAIEGVLNPFARALREPDHRAARPGICATTRRCRKIR